MSFLGVRSLCKSYPTPNGNRLKVLDKLSFEVEEGEFVALFGPNGCGKTTLLLLIAGIDSPDSGEVVLPNSAPGNHRVGVVFQNYREALLPWRNNLDNLCFPLELDGVSKTERRQRARELVKDLGLNIELETFPYQLSGGQQQLLSLGRALASNPKLLLLDEPLNSLDFQTSLRMCDEIQEAWIRTRITTVFISHAIDEAIYLSDRIYLLSKRPAAIRHTLKVNLPRPRTAETRKMKEFFELRNAALDLFKEVIAL